MTEGLKWKEENKYKIIIEDYRLGNIIEWLKVGVNVLNFKISQYILMYPLIGKQMSLVCLFVEGG